MSISRARGLRAPVMNPQHPLQRQRPRQRRSANDHQTTRQLFCRGVREGGGGLSPPPFCRMGSLGLPACVGGGRHPTRGSRSTLPIVSCVHSPATLRSSQAYCAIAPSDPTPSNNVPTGAVSALLPTAANKTRTKPSARSSELVTKLTSTPSSAWTLLEPCLRPRRSHIRLRSGNSLAP